MDWDQAEIDLLLIYAQHADQFLQVIAAFLMGLTGWAVVGIFFKGSKWLANSRGPASGS